MGNMYIYPIINTNYIYFIQIIYLFFLKGNSSDVCSTKSCVLAAASLLDSIDETINPCQDFYSFVCGNYIDKAGNTNLREGSVQLTSLHKHVHYCFFELTKLFSTLYKIERRSTVSSLSIKLVFPGFPEYKRLFATSLWLTWGQILSCL